MNYQTFNTLINWGLVSVVCGTKMAYEFQKLFQVRLCVEPKWPMKFKKMELQILVKL